MDKTVWMAVAAAFVGTFGVRTAQSYVHVPLKDSKFCQFLLHSDWILRNQVDPSQSDGGLSTKCSTHVRMHWKYVLIQAVPA